METWVRGYGKTQGQGFSTVPYQANQFEIQLAIFWVIRFRYCGHGDSYRSLEAGKNRRVLMIIFSVAWSAFVFQLNFQRTHLLMQSLGIILMVAVPFLVAGALFLISHYRKTQVSGKK